ncbi:hypothetical protein I3843_08G167900 [Carya illinoinensis]|nr:hypothetical protein I3843_08G167900 [Carya illinoinensis]
MGLLDHPLTPSRSSTTSGFKNKLSIETCSKMKTHTQTKRSYQYLK